MGLLITTRLSPYAIRGRAGAKPAACSGRRMVSGATFASVRLLDTDGARKLHSAAGKAVPMPTPRGSCCVWRFRDAVRPRLATLLLLERCDNAALFFTVFYYGAYYTLHVPDCPKPQRCIG